MKNLPYRCVDDKGGFCFFFFVMIHVVLIHFSLILLHHIASPFYNRSGLLFIYFLFFALLHLD